LLKILPVQRIFNKIHYFSTRILNCDRILGTCGIQIGILPHFSLHILAQVLVVQQ
jgi:hypothetical protein